MTVNMLIEGLLFAFWFFGPAGVANVVAFASGKIPFLKSYDYPADFYIKFRGKRLFGSHKTIRGFLVGIIGGIVTVSVEIFLYRHVWFVPDIIPIDYTLINPILLGFLLGFGALLGDTVKSFFKRLRGISPGRSWVPFDQVDYILGGIVLSWFYLPLSLTHYVFIFVLWIIIHPLATFLGYLLKLKRKPL